MRGGNYGVVAANHTLILNWNDQTVPLLRQIAINRTERGEGVYSGCARCGGSAAVAHGGVKLQAVLGSSVI